METYGWTLAQLGREFGHRLKREVVDKTGITGTFDTLLPGFPLPPPPGASPDPAGPDADSLVTAVLRKLGLKLEPAKGTAESLVIDHIERPTEN